jgi:putative DNA methylase
MESGTAFVAMDRLLDQCQSGPAFLGEPEIAKVVVAALYDGDRRFGRYELYSFVVMPNHVHLLVTPKVSSREWLGPLKGFTAHEANKILARHAPFRQPESYDHLVRNQDEFHRIRQYIENNPIRAGLAAIAEEFRWSSACQATPVSVGSGFLSPQSNFRSARGFPSKPRPGEPRPQA